MRDAVTIPSWSARLGSACLVACTGAVVAWPAGVVLADVGARVARGEVAASSAAVSWGLLGTTAAWAGGIALLAVLLGVPGAVWVARRGWGVVGWVAVPLLLPSYLCYAGYGLLRAPRSVLGDWIEQAVQEGMPWMPVFAGRVIAVAGLGLWAWPIASVVMALGLRGVSTDAWEMSRLDYRGWRGVLARAALVKGWLLAAWGVVALVMLGSAVPLHLAQAPTYTVRVWLEMSLAPGSAAAWVSAWPVLLAAVVGAGVVWGALRRGGAREAEGRRGVPTAGAARSFGSVTMLVLSVGVPLLLLAGAVDSWSTFTGFWVLNGPALGASAAVAAATGVWLAVITVLVWLVLASGDRWAKRVAGWCVGLWLLAAFVPGVLVGQAVASAWAWSESVRDWTGLVVFGQVARFGGVAALLGWALAASEGHGAREARRLDGATGLMGFLGMVLPGRVGAVVGVGLAGFCLSLHEIESCVFLQTPGSPGLALTMLGYLHYARMSDLSAAGVWLVGLGLLGAAAGAWASKGAMRSETPQP